MEDDQSSQDVALYGSLGNLDHRHWTFADDEALGDYQAAEAELRDILVRKRSNLGCARVVSPPTPDVLRSIARMLVSEVPGDVNNRRQEALVPASPSRPSLGRILTRLRHWLRGASSRQTRD